MTIDALLERIARCGHEIAGECVGCVFCAERKDVLDTLAPLLRAVARLEQCQRDLQNGYDAVQDVCAEWRKLNG